MTYVGCYRSLNISIGPLWPILGLGSLLLTLTTGSQTLQEAKTLQKEATSRERERERETSPVPVARIHATWTPARTRGHSTLRIEAPTPNPIALNHNYPQEKLAPYIETLSPRGMLLFCCLATASHGFIPADP